MTAARDVLGFMFAAQARGSQRTHAVRNCVAAFERRTRGTGAPMHATSPRDERSAS
jgi:hypothetical protein